jgi:chromosome segregation protein
MKQAEQDLFRYGSTWVRADFHLHTKVDGEFSFDGEEDYYFSSYIEALVVKGIRVGVIANHNKFNAEEFDALRKTAKKKGIYLLPGTELSSHDNIHVIIVFSEQWIDQGDLITKTIGLMFPDKTPEQYQNKNGRSDKTILQLVDELNKVGRDYFLVFAHVEDSKGLWNELKGRLVDWKEARYDKVRARTMAFQKVRTVDLRTQVRQWLGNWYPAEVEGSDCKKIAEIGKGQSVFLKIGAFNFEAVEYALRAPEDRVAPEPVRHMRSYIKSVKFEGGALNGQELYFSPGLNTFIGIRGSGKSSVLEALRYGLDLPFGDKVEDKEYKLDLVKHSLGSGGTVIIRAMDGFGQEFEVRRILDRSPDVYIQNKLQPGVSIRDTVIAKPLYFGQKDLSSSGKGFEQDLVEKLIGPEVHELRHRIEAQKETVLRAVRRYVKLGDIAERREEQQKRKLDAEFKFTRYTQYGLEEKLQKQMDFETDARRLDEMIQTVQEFRTTLTECLAEHEDAIRNHLLYKSKRNKPFFDSFYSVYKTAVSALESLKAEIGRLTKLEPSLERGEKEFMQLLDAFKNEFAATERAIGEEFKAAGLTSIRTEEFRSLSKSIEQATAIIGELDKESTKAAGIKNELLKELSALDELWHLEFDLIKTEMERVNAQHSSLSIAVEYMGDRNSFKSFMMDTMYGSKLREITYDKVIGAFTNPVEIFKRNAELDGLTGTSATIFKQYFEENLELFLLYHVPNRFNINYRGKPLKEHSLGQRASALMLFILSQKEHEVILIDQPEDDLDNQTIYQDVIKLVKTLKSDTQFIFATHNPNLPVLGDAEMVVSCFYSGDAVATQAGSIDDKVVQERIVTIMEGGQEAFKRRKEIYELWNPRNS